MTSKSFDPTKNPHLSEIVKQARASIDDLALPKVDRAFLRSLDTVLVPSGIMQGRTLAKMIEGSVSTLAVSRKVSGDLLDTARNAVVVASSEVPGVLNLAAALKEAERPGTMVLLDKSRSVEFLRTACRLGVGDVLPSTPSQDELLRAIESLGRALNQFKERDASRVNLEEINETNLQRIASLEAANRKFSEEVRNLEDKSKLAATATEFVTLIRSDLDVECFLRTTLEFILSQVGPTNAGVYLPSTSGDWSLGAYVNFDLPKDLADGQLESLANQIAPVVEKSPHFMRLGVSPELTEAWDDQHVGTNHVDAIAFRCAYQEEVLAVVVLFRDQANQYSQDQCTKLKSFSGPIGEQLARIVRIHNRHLPKDQWGGWASESDDEHEHDS